MHPAAARGLNGTGSGVSRGLNGEPTFLAYAPLPHAGLGLTVKVSQEEFLDGQGSAGDPQRGWRKSSGCHPPSHGNE